MDCQGSISFSKLASVRGVARVALSHTDIEHPHVLPGLVDVTGLLHAQGMASMVRRYSMGGLQRQGRLPLGKHPQKAGDQVQGAFCGGNVAHILP